LLADAARAGCRTIGGLDMLVAQAQAQFAWWTGQRPADRVMRDAALARLPLTETR
jgi:shikimate 5-dehydrogenase